MWKKISKNQNVFDIFNKELKEVNKFEVYEQFVDYLNEMSQKAEKSLFLYNAKDLTFKKENLSVRNELVTIYYAFKPDSSREKLLQA